jgi:hypothetical protein
VEHLWNICGTFVEHESEIHAEIHSGAGSITAQLCGTFVEHLWNICGTFVGDMQNVSGTFVEHLWNICGTFVEHESEIHAEIHSGAGSIAPQLCGTFVEHLWNICGTFVEHMPNERGTFVEHLWKICGTIVEHDSALCTAVCSTTR